MRYSTADIRKRFDAVTFRRGQACHEQGQVIELESADGGQILSARVRGDNGSSQQAQVQLREDARRFSTRCSCPSRGDCPHVVALLLAALERAPKAGLSQDVSAWVNDLFALHEAEDTGPAPRRPSAPRQARLHYSCSLPDHPEPHVAVRVSRQPGPQSAGKALSLNGRWQRGNIRHAEDRALFNRLRAFADESPYVARLADAGSCELFEDLVRSGYCHWDRQRRPLKAGPVREAKARWTVHEDGSQSLGLHVAARVLVLPLEPPCYVDLKQNLAGRVSTRLSPAILPLLGRAPRISPHQIDEFVRLLDARGISGVPRPQSPQTRTLDNCALGARLELMHIDDLIEVRDGFVPDIYVARLQACYGEFCFVPGQGEALSIRRQDDHLVRINRDLAAERALLERLPAFHGVEPQGESAGDQLILTPYDGNVAWARFLEEELPQLQERGWLVEVRDSFDMRSLEPENWTLETRTSGNDWFELSAGFEVEGERFNLLDILVGLLQDNDGGHPLLADGQRHLVVDLGEGRMLRLPRERIGRILDTLTELYRHKPLNRAGRLKLHKLDLARLEDWEESWSWRPPEQLRAFARSLRRRPEPCRLPKGFRGELRGYQADGLAWMQNLARHGLGGVLADDMGLGKTVQTLAHLGRQHEAGDGMPSLIVAPTSVIGNWRAEARRFTPFLPVLLWHGKARDPGSLRGAALVITSYATLLRDRKLLEPLDWELVVLDEAQYVKNPRAKISACVRKLRARQRLCLTGTPMENHLGELWSLFDFLAPGFLGDLRSFAQLYRNPIEKQANQARAEQLSRRVRPFLLRRRKDEVARELPPKSEILRTITLDEDQAGLYETVRSAMQERVRAALAERGAARSQLLILDALLKLRQICCDPRLAKLPEAQAMNSSAKLATLRDMLPELIEDGRRILLFSQFTEMLALIEQMLEELRIPHLKLTGASSNREELVQRFQAGEVPLFLISLKAGGTGLNLTAADTVIHYDPWWNPAVENQATDRAHRIGQDRPVFVYKLICENTVEERIQEMQRRKQQLSEQLYAAGTGALDEEELNWLLESNEPETA